MKRAITILVLLGVVRAAAGDEKLRDFIWSELQAAGRLEAGRVVPADDKTPYEHLVVENTKAGKAVITVLTIAEPKVTRPVYSVRGQVSYTGVEGEGYLEMLSHFPRGGPFYSRTVQRSGRMAGLAGSSGRRPFMLPFHITKTSDRPTKLVINVVLPGRGRVCLSAVCLAQYAKDEDPLALPGQWWSDEQAGWIGAIGGGALGLLGALIGCLGGAGKARRFVIAALKAMFLVGLAALVAGIVAVIQSQPYGVYYPLLLMGGLLTVLPLGLIPGVRKRYEQIELRRMQAMDAS